ncbi:electron transport complex subunit RsxC [Cetobacterium somerae]|uniref:electron transport complex subunit RsxC n=1 Tax=Cetobacterium sp. NK01 TaxID=2993530 RepID=UPI002117079E|nr:electron transport complex subunit RsxC [Cetobacterium sp. NK01]MCQ8211885.1 electron transport complex subunit RsxC [Cetobacterium sp. NK01]
MKFFGFKGGVHPPENKIQTENQAVEVLTAPKMVFIPLLQHIGVPLTPCVEVGERVLKGQIIADSDAFLSVPVHATVSGVVKKIENLPFPLMGSVQTIVIENDEKDEWTTLEKLPEWKNSTKEELLGIIRAKGIVGLGGAAFPTHIKLNPPSDVKIDMLLLNGAECEPYLNSDNRVMIEESTKVVEGIKIMKHILNVDSAVIGIEDNKLEAIEIMKKACQGTNIEVMPLKTMYPQGGEKSLIKAILNKEVPSGKLPSAVGVVVNNTTTAAAIYDAVVNGLPLIDKVVTVTGKAIKEPKNLKAVIGTPISELLEKCGYNEENVEKIVMGGPMMGMAQLTLEVPVIKGTSGLLALTKEETNYCKPKACIGCGKCVDACPMSLEPIMYARLAEFSQWEEMAKYHLMDCIECGSCAYICPANRPLTEAIKIGKAKLRTMKK